MAEEEFFESGDKIIDWSIIKNYQEEGTISGMLMAMLESDKLLNFMLSDMGYPGPTIYHKIKSARERFTSLAGLMRALETKEKIFTRYEERVSTRDVELSIKEYKKAIIDLSSSSDVAPPGLWTKFKSYIDYHYLSQPKNLRQLVIGLLSFIILILVLDNTHFGQRIIHGIASFFSRFISALILAALIVLVIIVAVVGFVSFLERRNRE